jgi:MFS family permease
MSLHQNIRKLKIFSAFRSYDALLPFYIIYAHHYGLSFFQIFVTQTVFAISVLIFEIPGGIFSDIYGRKLSLFSGSFFLMIGSLLLLTWRNFIGFCLADFLIAIGFTLCSGSDTALLYETTQELNQPESYLAHEGTMQAYSRYAEALSGLIGGILAQSSLFLLALVSFIGQVPNLYISATFKNASKATPPKKFKFLLKDRIFKQLKLIKDNLFNEKKNAIKLLLMYSSLVSSFTITVFWLLQVLMKSHNIALIVMGIIWLIYHCFSGYCSQHSKYIISSMGINKILLLIPLLLQIMSLGLGLFTSNWVLPLILISAVVFGIKMPFVNYLLNAQLANLTRASILSVDSMLTRLLFSILGLVIGYMLDHSTINHVFLLLTIPNIAIFFFAFKLIKKQTS